MALFGKQLKSQRRTVIEKRVTVDFSGMESFAEHSRVLEKLNTENDRALEYLGEMRKLVDRLNRILRALREAEKAALKTLPTGAQEQFVETAPGDSQSESGTIETANISAQ